MLTALAILLGLALAGLFLPMLIGLQVEHPGRAGAVRFCLNWGLLMGGAGVQLRFQAARWSLHPLVLGCGLGFPRLCLGKDRGEAEAPPLDPPPVPEEASPPAKPPAKAAAGRAGLGKLAGELVRPGLQLLRRLAQTFQLRSLRIEGRFGLADPAATGQLFGYLQGARALWPRRLHLRLDPDFVQQGMRGKVQVAIHFYFGKALFLVACFGVRLVWHRWRLGRAARRSAPGGTTPSTRR